MCNFRVAVITCVARTGIVRSAVLGTACSCHDNGHLFVSFYSNSRCAREKHIIDYDDVIIHGTRKSSLRSLR